MKKLPLALLVAVFSIGSMLAQRTIQGTISDEAGEPLIGATVLVKGTSTGTVSDVDGTYQLSVPEGATTIQVSYTGFASQEIALGASDIIDVTMLIDAIGLEDVIVVGYGTQSNRYKVQSISTINENQLKNRPVIGPQEMLQGQAPGVQMVGNSGLLGANATVRIRGASSINAGSDPLYVVDGVPLNNGSSGSYSQGQGGAPLNPLADLNPNDIESISVLKDAAAAAIYGSRGANGVILITTKKGKAGSNKVSADYYTGFGEPTFKLDMMNADEFRTFMKAYNNRDFPNTGFDWPAAVKRTARVNSYNVNMSGGSDKTQYFLSGSMLDQSNYAIGNELQRMNARLNFKHTMSEKFRFGANIGISRVFNDRVGQENNTFAPYTSAFLQLPTVEAFDADGKYTRTGFIANVLAIEDLSIRQLVTDRTTANAYLTYDILPGLSLNTDWGIDKINNEETVRDPDIVSVGGSGSNAIIADNKWLTSNSLNYSKEYGDHAINAVANLSYETALFTNTTVAGRNFAADALRNIASAATPTTTFASRTQWALLSQIGRLNYRFKDRYIVETMVRRDGSSRFGANNRWGTFWAVSGGWLVSEEAFMESVSFINNLKLSASYGLTGNDQIGNFPSLGLYGSGVAYDYSGLAGIGPNQPSNPDLKWETTKQLDLGISVAMFNSRLAIDANYYIKNTIDLLLNFNLPDVNGFSTVSRNAGEMTNKGVDLNIQTVNMRTKDFEWSTNLNVGFLKNEVTSLPDAALDEDGRPFLGGTNQRAIVGHSLNTFYLPRYVGINAETGDAEWLDRNGEIVKNASSANRVIVGSAIPKFTGGFTNNFSYKGIDLNVFFNFSYGNDVFLGDLNFTENPTTNFNKSRQLLNYWTESNKTGAFAPAPTSATRTVFAQNSTLQLLDGSFLRLRNITLGYTLRGKSINAKFFESVRVYVMGQNLWTLRAEGWEGRGQDPEVGYASSNTFQGQSFFTPPQVKMITFGASVQF